LIGHKALAIITVPVLAASLILVGSVPAGAAVQDNTKSKGYVVVQASEGIAGKGGAVFYPTGPISSDTLVVIAEPDGSLPGGLTEDRLREMVADRKAQGSAASKTFESAVAMDPVQASAQSGAVTSLAATQYGYGASSSIDWSGAWTGGGKIGLTDTATASYSFLAAAFTSQRNVAQGLGYYRGYNGSQFGTWSAWYNLGSATASTAGGGAVPWGNVSAVSKLRAKCATTTICGGYFS